MPLPHNLAYTQIPFLFLKIILSCLQMATKDQKPKTKNQRTEDQRPEDHSEWWTSPLEDEDGNRIMVTGRGDIEKFRNNPRFNIRVTVSLPYDADAQGMPRREAAEQLEQIVDLMQAELHQDPVAVLTGLYTGAGRRDMVFYTASTNIFNKKLNSALASLPLLPLEISAENDPEWAEYDEMRELSEIN